MMFKASFRSFLRESLKSGETYASVISYRKLLLSLEFTSDSRKFTIKGEDQNFNSLEYTKHGT